VALKIVVACLTGDKGESTLLTWLNATSRDHPGAGHILQLRDSFQIHGPNGTHQVLVMDILQTFYSLLGTNALSQQSRSICYQLLLGLAYLQQEGVVHGGKQTLLIILLVKDP
jgi:serine/threonine protein kinase